VSSRVCRPRQDRELPDGRRSVPKRLCHEGGVMANRFRRCLCRCANHSPRSRAPRQEGWDRPGPPAVLPARFCRSVVGARRPVAVPACGPSIIPMEGRRFRLRAVSDQGQFRFGSRSPRPAAGDNDGRLVWVREACETLTPSDRRSRSKGSLAWLAVPSPGRSEGEFGRRTFAGRRDLIAGREAMAMWGSRSSKRRSSSGGRHRGTPLATMPQADGPVWRRSEVVRADVFGESIVTAAVEAGRHRGLAGVTRCWPM